MRSGRGGMIAAAAFAVLVAAGAFAWFVTSSGPNEYGQLGRQVNGMRGQYFDAFWGCALPREDLRDIGAPEEMRSIIARFSRSPRGYAEILRRDCLHLLDEHRAPLDALIPAPGLGEPIGQWSAALTALRAAWEAYVAYLETPDLTFDPEDPTASSLLRAVVQGWLDYRTAFGEINDIVREHLEE